MKKDGRVWPPVWKALLWICRDGYGGRAGFTWKRGRDQVCLLLVSPAASCFSSVYSPVPQGIVLVIPPKKHSSASYGDRAGQNNGAVSSSPWKSWVRAKTAHTSLLPFSLFPYCKKKIFQTAKQDKY